MIHNDTHMLLGMKKRGFGEGRWNGFGGKVTDGEAIEEATKRELKEEAGITVVDIDKRGIIGFSFENNSEMIEVHIFSACNFEGEPTEREEMRPQWFAKDEIPFDTMWIDDEHWIPMFLEGKKFRGNFHFTEDEKSIISYNIEEVLEL